MAGILDGVDKRTQLAGQNRLELLLFRLSTKQRFGINVFKVQEVIQCPKLTQVPGLHKVVRGVANMRGRTIPVLDLSLAIGAPPTDELNGRFVIVTEYNRSIQGFLVGTVDRIVNMNWEAILPPPKAASGSSYLTAVTNVDDELVEIIDVEKVLKEVNDVDDHVAETLLDQKLSLEDIKVLVVDDSAVARNQVKRVLDQLGIESILKENGREALEQLVEWAKDDRRVSEWVPLVISDVEMPQMDGYSLTTSIRSNPLLNDLHVILHTSLSGVFNKSMIQKVGADQFLPKYEPNSLAKAVLNRMSDFSSEKAA
ncbi:MAG TPA: chemotaxis protein CheV [Chromatiales bacterium]|nr:chemotaxis protein CheV [Chromatiales bacterium]